LDITNTNAHKKLVLSKVMQLIVAYQLSKVNVQAIEADLALAMQNASFNIFRFTQRYLK
jgi:hypothetical protein